MPLFRRRQAKAPADPEPADSVPAHPEVERDPGPPVDDRAPVSVLVVDDDEDLRFVMTTALAREGFTVLGSAGTAAEALVLAAAEPKPDIVLLDLHMPDVTGLELMPQLREATPESRFVVCSAISASHMLEAALEAGVTGFIVKGVSARSIGEHLRRVANAGLFKIVRPYPLNRDY